MHVTEDRVRELDGLRAAAVLFVVAWHYIGMQGTSGDGLWSVVTFGRGGFSLCLAILSRAYCCGIEILRISFQYSMGGGVFAFFRSTG